MNILVLNPGSATLKFGLHEMPGSGDASFAIHTATPVVSGIVERIGTPRAEMELLVAGQKLLSEPIEAGTPAQAAERIVHRLLADVGDGIRSAMSIDAIGCRVVHGGERFVQPTRVSPAVLDELRALEELAPLHLPADIALLELVQQSLPRAPLIAVFDTAFHQTLPEVARTYALPVGLSARHGLRRYGFHGISHAHVSAQLIELLGRGAKGTRLITCHLGSGASVCAVLDGISIDISMGLTPMEGLVMGTRSGDVDPGLVLYLIRAARMTAGEVDDLLNNESGLRGLSGLSSDMRDLEQAALEKNERAELALEIFAYRARKYIGAFAAALGGVDAIAFTGGIGERSDSMRSRICRNLEFLGLRVDAERNHAANGDAAMRISAESAAVQAWVIPASEERQIALSTYEELRRCFPDGLPPSPDG